MIHFMKELFTYSHILLLSGKTWFWRDDEYHEFEIEILFVVVIMMCEHRNVYCNEQDCMLFVCFHY